MRTLFVIDTLGAGGAERSLQEMMPLFERAGVSPIIACFHRRKAGVEHLVFGRHDVRVLDGLSRLGRVTALRKLLRDERVELVHTSLFEADVLGRLATVGTNVAVVTSLVNMAYEPDRRLHDRNVSAAKLAVVRGLEAATGLLFVDHFHAISHAVKDAAVTYYGIPPRRITVVYRGRDRARLGVRSAERRARVREALGLPLGAYVVLTAGRQEYQKGQRFLIEAMARLLPGDPSAVLLVAGREGNASTELAAVARRAGPTASIRFLGHRDDLPDLMAASDLFALPSLWEGLGGVLVEAMALELPIVASDIDAVREATAEGDAGVLVPRGDPVALADAISRVRDDATLRGRLVAAGAALFERRYSLERSADGMLRVFQKAVQRHHNRHATALPTR